MMKSWVMTVVLASSTVVSLIYIGYTNRFEIGLGKPKYSVGQCISETFSTSEFDTTTINFQVTEIGKTDYNLTYIFNGAVSKSSTQGRSISRTDDDYHEIPCPKQVSKK